MLHVHVAPGAARAAVVGFHGDALRVRVHARPVEGAANRELLAVLAGALRVRPASLSVERGGHRRDKRIRVEGLTPEVVRRRLLDLLFVDTPVAHD